MTNWAEFDDLDVKSLNEEVKDLGGDYPDIPKGEYEVDIVKMEMKPTKKGFPMLSAQFKILKGEYKNQSLFMNQVLIMRDQNDKYRISGAEKFLKSLGTGVVISFEGVSAFGKVIDQVFKQLKFQKLEYLIEVDIKNDFYSYKIKDVYEPE